MMDRFPLSAQQEAYAYLLDGVMADTGAMIEYSRGFEPQRNRDPSQTTSPSSLRPSRSFK